MRRDGLREVENPSEFMLNGRPENASGSVVACSMEGTRPILLEIQALVCESNFGNAKKNSSRNRLQQGEPSDGGFGKKDWISSWKL